MLTDITRYVPCTNLGPAGVRERNRPYGGLLHKLKSVPINGNEILRRLLNFCIRRAVLNMASRDTSGWRFSVETPYT